MQSEHLHWTGFDPTSVAQVKRALDANALDAGTRGIELEVYSDQSANPEVHHAGWTNAVGFLECRHGWERTSDPLLLFIENEVGSDETLNQMGHIIRQNIPESRLLKTSN